VVGSVPTSSSLWALWVMLAALCNYSKSETENGGERLGVDMTPFSSHICKE
jgi:hypothetical protein